MLKAFLRWMRPYEHQLCMDEVGSEELHDVQAVPLLMQQMLLGCQITGRQLDQGLQYFHAVSRSPNKSISPPAWLSDSLCGQNSSLDL